MVRPGERLGSDGLPKTRKQQICIVDWMFRKLARTNRCGFERFGKWQGDYAPLQIANEGLPSGAYSSRRIDSTCPNAASGRPVVFRLCDECERILKTSQVRQVPIGDWVGIGFAGFPGRTKQDKRQANRDQRLYEKPSCLRKLTSSCARFARPRELVASP